LLVLESHGKLENVLEKVMESHGIWTAQKSTNSGNPTLEMPGSSVLSTKL